MSDYYLPKDPKEYRRLMYGEPLPWPTYVVHPEWMFDVRTGSSHFVNAETIMRRYKVDPNICAIMHGPGAQEHPEWADRIHLYPRWDGNYRLPGM